MSKIEKIEKKIEKYLKYFPFIGYLGFFGMYIVLGIVLISGISIPQTHGLVDLPVYQALSYFDLLILLAMNIPTFIIVGFALKKTIKEE